MEAKQICIRTPQTTIYDLNDDVLRETFGHMNVEELVAVVDVCSTFRRIAVDEFASRKYELVFSGDYSDRFSEYNNNINRVSIGIGYPHSVSFIQRFGNEITSIRMFTHRDVPLKLIEQYCSQSLLELHFTYQNWTKKLILERQPTLSRIRNLTLGRCKFESSADASQMLSCCLELHSLTISGVDATHFVSPVILPKLNSLKLRDMKFTNEMISSWQPSLARVKKLVIEYCEFESGEDASQMLSFCVELQWLSLHRTNIEVLVSPVALPKLKSLKFFGHDEDIVSAVEQLLARNPQLETVKLPLPSSRRLIEMVHQYVPNIAEIRLTYESEVSVDLKQFKNLKSLDITYSAMPILKAAAEAAIPLERLGVRCLQQTATEFIQLIPKFNAVREIYLGAGTVSTLDDLFIIVRTFPELSILYLGWMEFPFAAIPEIIKCGPKLQSFSYENCIILDEFLDEDLFMRIRNAVVDHSVHRPFRFNAFHHFKKLKVSRKLQKANSHIFQIECLEFEY